MSVSAMRSLTFAAVLAGACIFAIQADAEQNNVIFPVIEDLTHYTTVERGITVEHMLTTPEALAAIKAGVEVPMGTPIVLQDFQSGVLTRYLIAQKLGEGSQNWEYQWFWPDGSIKADERTDRCYSCHLSRENEQFMFTHADALSFGE